MQINHIIQFQELLSITINHGYYYNNRCNDFIFEVENEIITNVIVIINMIYGNENYIMKLYYMIYLNIFNLGLFR